MKIIYSASAVYVAIVSLLSGIAYLTRPEFMPYHEIALGAKWENLSPSHQTLHLGLMRVVGASFLCTFIAVTILAWRDVRLEERWAGSLAGVLPLLLFSVSLYANLLIASQTEAVPPWYGTASSVIAAMIMTGTALVRRRQEVH